LRISQRLGFDDRIESVMEKILLKLDLPSRSDITAINDRIDELTKKFSDKA